MLVTDINFHLYWPLKYKFNADKLQQLLQLYVGHSVSSATPSYHKGEKGEEGMDG